MYIQQLNNQGEVSHFPVANLNILSIYMCVCGGWGGVGVGSTRTHSLYKISILLIINQETKVLTVQKWYLLYTKLQKL